jgi:hypothetical protein
MKIAVILPETRCIRLRQGPWNFGVLAASPSATRLPPVQDRPRRFPPPWDIEEHNRSCFIVRSGFGLRVFRGRSRKLLTRDEARRIAANIAKLPEML